MSIVVKQPESGSSYMLKYNGVDAGMTVLPGDAEVKWDIAQVGSGVYTVSAERDGCTQGIERQDHGCCGSVDRGVAGYCYQ